MRMRNSCYFCISASIVLSSAAQLFIKAGMIILSNRSADMTSFEFGGVQNTGVIAWVVAGLLCYAFSLFAWMFAISRLDLSFAYPVLSLSYVLVFLGAGYWEMLNEELSAIRGIGIVTIILGVF